MARYIDAETLSNDINVLEPFELNDDEKCIVFKTIRQQPTADVVEVVRCKDCRHFITTGGEPYFCKYHTDNAGYCDEACWVTENDFCSYGEVKE